MITEEQQKQLRAPFPDAEIGKLPRIFCKACKDNKFTKMCDQHKTNTKCRECGQKHSTASFHLDYVGHAETTDRLLAVDPEWSWEPVAFGQDGTPAFDKQGGLWIRLTICGVSRIGYGNAEGKSGGDAVKEIIGDAIRNAAMRFGVALDLWRRTEAVEFHDEPAEAKPEPKNTQRSAADLARDRVLAYAQKAGIPPAGLMAEFHKRHNEDIRKSDNAAAINALVDEYEAAA